MAKTKERLPSVTEAARSAGKALSAWAAVEVAAKKAVGAAEAKAAPESFAEFHFTGATVRGVVKAGSCVLKVEV